MSRLGIFVDRKTLSNLGTAQRPDPLPGRCREYGTQCGISLPGGHQQDPENGCALYPGPDRPDEHHVRAARMADFHGIPVIDDADSIQVCGDKINMYLHLIRKNVALPKTIFLSKNDLCVERVSQLFDTLGTPLIIKEPSTSFSLRVEKVMDIAGFFRVARRFIKMSDWIVVQQFVESTYDWRVGVLGGQLLYACKYTIPSVTFKIQASVNGHIVYAVWRACPRAQSRPMSSSSGSMRQMPSETGCMAWISRTTMAMPA